MDSKEIYVKVTKDGPYLVYGVPDISTQVILNDDDGYFMGYEQGAVLEIKSSPTALCRCGKSKNAPFCDGKHLCEHFDGTETASFEPILDDALKFEGPNLTLYDNEKYCAFARFCDANGGIWDLISIGKKETDECAILEANLCPSGRLVIFDKDGNTLEEQLPPSIALIEDNGLKVSGPIWVRGSIKVESADGKTYEIRNKQTLCRCGKSANKPFCDCTHRR